MSIQIVYRRNPLLSGLQAFTSGYFESRRQSQNAEAAAQFQLDQQEAQQNYNFAQQLGSALTPLITFPIAGALARGTGLPPEAVAGVFASTLVPQFAPVLSQQRAYQNQADVMRLGSSLRQAEAQTGQFYDVGISPEIGANIGRHYYQSVPPAAQEQITAQFGYTPAQVENLSDVDANQFYSSLGLQQRQMQMAQAATQQRAQQETQVVQARERTKLQMQGYVEEPAPWAVQRIATLEKQVADYVADPQNYVPGTPTMLPEVQSGIAQAREQIGKLRGATHWTYKGPPPPSAEQVVKSAIAPDPTKPGRFLVVEPKGLRIRQLDEETKTGEFKNADEANADLALKVRQHPGTGAEYSYNPQQGQWEPARLGKDDFPTFKEFSDVFQQIQALGGEGMSLEQAVEKTNRVFENYQAFRQSISSNRVAGRGRPPMTPEQMERVGRSWLGIGTGLGKKPVAPGQSAPGVTSVDEPTQSKMNQIARELQAIGRRYPNKNYPPEVVVRMAQLQEEWRKMKNELRLDSQ